MGGICLWIFKNMLMALRLADERMYEDKRRFYEAHPELKR